MRAPRKPLLVYDGECDFCRTWIERWRHETGDRVDYAPYQEVAASFPEIPQERFKRSVQLLEPNGRRSEGAEAVFRSLAHAPVPRVLLWLHRHTPPFAATSEWIYRLVASHRPAFTRLTRWIWGAHLVPPGETATAWLFLRAIGVVWLVAFLSLWSQIPGLIGSGGILPAEPFLGSIPESYGARRFWYLPTVFWLGAGDGELHLVAGIGIACAVLATIGVVPALALAGAWVSYLSLATVARDFLWFQWDSLLLETGFLAIFLSPWRLFSWPARDPRPSPVALWLVRWLLFRLMIASAAVKLSSGDPTWRNLTALRFHYETQPLPPWTAWYAHHLPPWFHTASALGMFAVEGLVPLLILGPRRIRFAAALAIAGLQTAIALTGNYGFFNVLTIALCVTVLDDGVWPRRWRRWWGTPRPRAAASDADEIEPRPTGRAPRGLVGTVAVALVLLSLVPLFDAFRWPRGGLGPLAAFYRAASPFEIVNRYGLFAVMTTRRPEIVVEGSRDGRVWLPYEFRWKPGDPARPPAFVAPHQPRVDWQMWFAALGGVREHPWFLSFCERLLQGSPAVLRLLARDPFAPEPPRFLRAVVYDYHFTDAATRKATGDWWRREALGLYCPVLTLVGGRLAVATPDSVPSRPAPSQP